MSIGYIKGNISYIYIPFTYKKSMIMLFSTFVSLLLIHSITCLDENVIDMSIDYFNYRNVKFVCLLSCEDNYRWTTKFVKYASKQNMAVSKTKIDKNWENTNHLGLCLYQHQTPVGVLVDANCPGFEKAMNFASLSKMLDATHKWLIIDDNQLINIYLNDTESFIDANITDSINNSEVVVVVEKLDTSVDSDIVLGFRKDSNGYDLYEAFNFGKVQGGVLTVESVGFWHPNEGLVLQTNLNRYKYYRRWNFQQWSMRMIVVFSDPPEHFDQDMIVGEMSHAGVALITQTAATILTIVADKHNFRYHYTLAERWIGTYEKNNTNKEVTTSLYYHDQDISPVIRISSFTLGKIDVVHPPLESIETRYFYRIPTFGPGKFENQFLRPLTAGSWLCSVAVIALCALALMVSAKLEHHPMPAQYAVFSVSALFCQQFFDDNGRGETRKNFQARRIAMLVTGLSCVLIFNYYTSSVVSWLLNGPPPSINSLQELLDSPLELIFEDIGYTRSWLQTPGYYYNKKNAKLEDALRNKKVFSKKKGDPLLMKVDEGIEMVRAGGYAFHTEVSSANMLISRKFNQIELCELGSLQSMEETLLYPAIQKDSPYKEFFIWNLARLSETGIVSCIKQRTSSSAVACAGSSPRALALGGAAPAFILLAFGYLLATVIMLLERLHHRRPGRIY